MCAAERGRTEIVHYLIEQDVDLDVHEYYQSETALTLASGKDCIDIVCALVEAGALLNECSRMGTALCIAIKYGHTALAHYLIEQDADLDMTYNQSGNTALSLAINAGDLDMVRLLREKGANTSTMINGKTLRDIACDIYGANSPIALLLEG
jgi:ankyrin repeat protein